VFAVECFKKTKQKSTISTSFSEIFEILRQKLLAKNFNLDSYILDTFMNNSSYVGNIASVFQTSEAYFSPQSD